MSLYDYDLVKSKLADYNREVERHLLKRSLNLSNEQAVVRSVQNLKFFIAKLSTRKRRAKHA